MLLAVEEQPAESVSTPGGGVVAGVGLPALDGDGADGHPVVGGKPRHVEEAGDGGTVGAVSAEAGPGGPVDGQLDGGGDAVGGVGLVEPDVGGPRAAVAYPTCPCTMPCTRRRL